MWHALTLLALALPLLTAAQRPDLVHHTPRQQYAFTLEAPTEYVLRGGSALRSAPSLDAALVATLAAGGKVTIEEQGVDTLRIDGVVSHWYRIQAGDRSGWTWGGNLAEFAFGSAADAQVKFVAGLDHYAPMDTSGMEVAFRLVAIKGGKELDRIVVRSFSSDFEQVRALGNLGLRNVDDVITLTVPCNEGCGCTTGEVVVFWSGDRFHHVADLMGSPDGDHSVNVTFTFPSDMEGEEGMILRETSDYVDAECPEEEDDAMRGHCIERIARTERLVWDGTRLIAKGAPMERRYILRTGTE